MSHPPTKEWTDVLNADFRAKWDDAEHWSVYAMARHFRCSSQQIRRHRIRLQLPPRPTPCVPSLNPDSSPKKPSPLAPGASTLPPLGWTPD
jgi:hypothetical protein